MLLQTNWEHWKETTIFKQYVGNNKLDLWKTWNRIKDIINLKKATKSQPERI